MRYRFELLTDRNYSDAADFVRLHEYRCINLAEQLRLCGMPFQSGRFKKAALLYVQTAQRNICKAVFFLTVHGILLHCIDCAVRSEEALEAFASFFFSGAFPFDELYAVVGSHRHTLFLESYLRKDKGMRPVAVQDYHLMRRTEVCAPPSLQNAQELLKTRLFIRRAAEDDADMLFPLQLAYENEEIAFDGSPIQPAVCRLSLQARLKSGYLYFVFDGTAALAKAGSNAQGFDWIQIGGVYTLPAYRRMGLAAAVTAHLVNVHIAGKRGIALFVKTTNQAAIRVYRKIGFEPCGLFRMSYW